jgi:hypothetical protein
MELHDLALPGAAPKPGVNRVATHRHVGSATMATTAVGGTGNDGRAAPSGGVLAARTMRGPWARRLSAWLTNTGYRPERHYMRGGRQSGATSPRPRPA